ncbi:MAG TPA: hydroxymethylbilane synthase [Candidatus Polarisedimenticolia bacterium]|nr:hydroxymethylbilane synthase [Candidatus Polarisedimenticolia bacterium]
MILGTRGSPLALGQTAWVRRRLRDERPEAVIEVSVIRTTGDRRQAAPPDAAAAPSGEAGKGIFVKEIEEAMLERRIDAAVHSLKDLPTDQPDGLLVACIPCREDPRDVLVTAGGLRLDQLPRGARVGTGSPRRAAQLRCARPDLVIEPVRGNVDTRVRRMIEGQFDAVVLAAAGLARLGLARQGGLPGAAVSPLEPEVCMPAVGQGALALEARAGDRDTIELLRAIADPAASAEVAAERAFLAGLGGGCTVPVGALARCPAGGAGTMTLRGIIASIDGTTLLRFEEEGEAEEAEEIGRRLAARALAAGGGRLLP